MEIMKKTTRLTMCLLGAALLAVPTSQAALSKLGGEFPLLGDIAGHQKNPNVALSQLGGFVVWQNMPSTGRFEQVMIQRIGSDMTGMGVPTRMSQATAQGNELNPRVAMLAGGGAAAVWESGSRASTDVYMRILNASGSFVTGALPVNTRTAGNQNNADVAVLSNGNVVVVWSSEGQDGDGSGVYGQLFTSGGARLGGEFQVNGTASMTQSDPAVAAMSDGRFAVAWVSETVNGRTGSGAPNLRGNIMGRIFGATGSAQGNEYRLNDGDTLATSPVLTAATDGGFVAAWTQRDEANTRNLNDVLLRTFNASGVPAGKSEKHNTHLKGQQAKPELVQLAGDALVAWTSYGQDASGAGVQGRLASGGTEFQVNTQGQLHQTAPTVATDGASKFLVVWVNTIKPSHSILSAQRYVTSNSSLDGVVDVTSGEVQVVSADAKSRITGTASAATAASDAPAASVASTPGFQVSPPPSLPAAPAAPAAVAVSAIPSAAPPLSAAPVAPRSLASTRASAPSMANRSIPRPSAFGAQRSATAGLSMMRSLSQRRSMGRPSVNFGGRATQMARAPQSRFSRSAGPSRGLPGQGLRPGFGSSRGGQGSLANRRANPTRPTASGMLRGMNRGSTGGRGAPTQSSTVRASLQRGSAGGYNLSWQSQQGRRYVVQGSNDLKSWNNVGTARSGHGGQDSVSVGGANSPRYFRVRQAN